MSSNVAIRASAVTKGFESYERPSDRLKRSVFGLFSKFTPSSSVRQALEKKAQGCVRTFWALKGVDFEIARGETVGIIGRNGSGKSTLLQIICGTLMQTQGDVQIHGRIAALLELGSGFDAEYTGRENIYMNGQLHGLTREQIDSRLEQIISFADIGHFIDQPVKTYSSGMFVRLAFAVIAHVDADILVIDEALSVGDAFFTQKCMRFLRQFQQTGTILFVSHDSGAVRSLCKRVIWLDRGEIRGVGDPKDVCTRYFEAFYQQRQGPSTSDVSFAESDHGDAKTLLTPASQAKAQTADQRMRFVTHASAVENAITSICIDPHHLPTQRESALIESVQLLNDQGSAVSWVEGGERIRLCIRTKIPLSGDLPVIAFFVKDRLGQALFGDDTALAKIGGKQDSATMIEAEFVFNMPILPPGDYAFTALAATGPAHAPIVLDCFHDARVIKSESASVATGLVGLRMTHVDLFVQEALAERKLNNAS
jgi:lipopolysaccharide transport system ATP-binding protein